MTNCCVCLEEDTKTCFIKCNKCANTTVCSECFDVMKSNNIHNTCPICRSTMWYNSDHTVIIVYEPEHVEIESIQLNREQKDTNCRYLYVCYISRKIKACITYVTKRVKPCCIMFAKFILLTLLIWLLGFVVMLIYYSIFYSDNHYYIGYIHHPFVFTLTYIVGLFLCFAYSYCKSCCSNIESEQDV